MSGLLLKTKFVSAIQNEKSDGNLLLVIANHATSAQGRIIEQVTSTRTHFVFEAQGRIAIDSAKVLEKVEIRCLEDANKYLIPSQEYHLIIKEINKKDNYSNPKGRPHSSESKEQSQDDQDPQNHLHFRKRINQFIDSYNEESENNQDQEHRGRGRPKGSKNKKTIIKEGSDPKSASIELKIALNGRITRGKGRPKGSKNKVKSIIKVEHRESQAEDVESAPFGKRGKGRPKGSKNKIKAAIPLPPMLKELEHQKGEKKKRGRPPGAKNRPNSIETPSNQKEQTEEFVRFHFQKPNLEEVEKVRCCRRCNQRNLQTKILDGLLETESQLDNLWNVDEDLGLEQKTNLILTTIKLGDWETFEMLLKVAHKQEPHYKAPWMVERCVQKTRFAVKTKKEHLSKTGKEDNNALLHDCLRRKSPWWRQISVDRIIENLPREDVDEILRMILQSSEQLKEQLEANLASIIRSGNALVSEIILKSSKLCLLNFSQEHLELLVGSTDRLNSFKKFNLIKPNESPNHCSPIHCAAISNNPTFLKKLLSVFTDIHHVEDSLKRKPVHYAAVASNVNNLWALVEAGAQLKEYDLNKMTPLMLACSQGLLTNAEYILEKVRDQYHINFKSDEGYNALHYAILHNQQECIDLLINDPHVDLWALTKDKEDVFHLLAGTGNIYILQQFLKKQMLPTASQDRFKRTPAMIAIRNHNNAFLYRILEEGCKYEKTDSSQNTLLHYAAAYGNVEALLLLQPYISQTDNKKLLYPSEIAILKGHLGCTKLLESRDLQFDEDPLFLALSNIRGTDEYFQVIKYINENMNEDIEYRDKSTSNGYLHQVCSLSEDQYVKVRKQEVTFSQEEIKEEFAVVQHRLISHFLELGLSGHTENKKQESPFKICIENMNLIGFQKFLTGKVNFELESSSGNTVMHCFANLACKGLQEIKFVEKKLKEKDKTDVKSHLKKADHNGFDFLLYLVKTFTENAPEIYLKLLKQKTKQIANQPAKKQSKDLKKDHDMYFQHKAAITQFAVFEERFIDFLKWLICDTGCDVNSCVQERKSELSQRFKKWGIQHFLMKFPSVRLITFFKGHIKDFNLQNGQSMTPLHVFCRVVKESNLLQIPTSQVPQEYKAINSLQFLLQNGVNPNRQDADRSLPILYSALNNCYHFVIRLLDYKSEINFCSAKNEVPLTEIIKRRDYFTADKIEKLLRLNADPNFVDHHNRNCLHHLVNSCEHFDNSSQICKMLLAHKVKVNALDSFGRSPIFYCFTGMGEGPAKSELQQKIQILEILAACKEIDLNSFDKHGRTLVHYACQNNYFFSLMYLFENIKGLNLEAKDNQGNTPLALCLINNHLEQAALLIRRGVKAGQVFQEGRTQSYFGYAYSHFLVGICFMLLEGGYPLNAALHEVEDSNFRNLLLSRYKQ